MKCLNLCARMKRFYKMNFEFHKQEALTRCEYLNILRHLKNGNPNMPLKEGSVRSRRKYGLITPYQCCVCGSHFPQLKPPSVPTSENPLSANYIQGRRFAICGSCDGKACRPACGQWVQQRGKWLCKQCVLQNVQFEKRDDFNNSNRGAAEKSWFRSILTALQPNAISVRMSKSRENSIITGVVQADIEGHEIIPKSIPEVALNHNGPSTSGTGDEKEIVRDFIERLVGAMLGADLDDTSVGKLYGDAEYDAIFDRYHGDISSSLVELGSALHISIANLPVTGQTPCTAHASLKNIIRRVLRDASNLAILKQPQTDEDLPVSTNKRTYEDLLATAILNKVIDNYQTDIRRSSSGSTSSKGSNVNSKKQNKNRKYEEDRWRTNVENPDFDTTSVSSVEEWCRSESSCGSKFVDHMNFTIKQSIEEASTSDDESPSNHYLTPNNLPQSKNTGDKYYQEDWQDNWLFSRRDKSSPKPVPVPMLVPNPSTEYRALIGDRDAEDTTDLSETGSDLEENDSIHDIKAMLVDSRTIIGGKNLLGDITNSIYENMDAKDQKSVPMIEKCVNKGEIKTLKNDTAAEEASKDSGVDEDLVSEAKNSALITEIPYVESDSFSSNTEKDMEYTERYASIPRQISKPKKSPIPSPRTSMNTVTDKQREELIQNYNKTTEDDKKKEVDEIEIDDEEEEEKPLIIRGSYSEKEKAKWRNPVVLSNNPYSKENLDKRLQNTTSVNDTAFGRDYYIREAKKAAGGREKFLKNLQEGDPQNNSDNSTDLELESPVEYVKSDPNIFTAVPAVVQEEYHELDDVQDEEEHLEENKDNLTDLQLESIPPSRPISLALSTDSEDADVKRVYNLETGKITKYRNSDFAKKIIEDSKSPVGTAGLIISNELVDTPIEEKNNNNNLMEATREPIMNISKLNHILNASSNSSSNNNSSLESEDIILKPSYRELQPEELSEDEIEIVTSPGTETHAVFTPPEMRDSTKKFLLNLVKNKTNVTPINNIASTPPISLQELDNFKNINNLTLEIETPTGNLIDIQTSEITPDIELNNKSCIDLRFIGQLSNNKPAYQTQMSLNSSLLSTQSNNGFAQSTPNLNDDYYDDHTFTNQKNKDLEELSELLKPSVKDLKKLFDEDEDSERITISRTNSHLTTKPELRAHRQIHSLTARSLSKEFRRELSKTEDRNEVIIENNSVEDEEEDQTNEFETIPPCQSKIAFFETLKNNN